VEKMTTLRRRVWDIRYAIVHIRNANALEKKPNYNDIIMAVGSHEDAARALESAGLLRIAKWQRRRAIKAYEKIKLNFKIDFSSRISLLRTKMSMKDIFDDRGHID
jgi:hypothetical protein